jgi:hypothetical protein
MAYDVPATPLQRIFPQFLAMTVQFLGDGKAAAAKIAAAAAAATAGNLARDKYFFFGNGRVGGGEVTSCGYGASLVQASCNVCAIPVRF